MPSWSTYPDNINANIYYNVYGAQRCRLRMLVCSNNVQCSLHLGWIEVGSCSYHKGTAPELFVSELRQTFPWSGCLNALSEFDCFIHISQNGDEDEETRQFISAQSILTKTNGAGEVPR